MEFKKGDLVEHTRNSSFRAGIVLDVREEPKNFIVPQIQVRFFVGGTGWFRPYWLRRLTADTAPTTPG